MKYLLRRSLALLVMISCPLPVQAVPLHVFVTDAPYSADGSDNEDDSPAFKAALEAIKNAGGGVLVIPEGLYLFDEAVEFNSDSQVSEQWKDNLTIECGTGSQARLRSRNTKGVFLFTCRQYAQKYPRITIRNLIFEAGQIPGAPQPPGALSSGTAIQMNKEKRGAQPARTLTVEDVTIRSLNVNCYFQNGIVAINSLHPLIKNCSFTAPGIMATTGFDVSGSYGPVFDACSVTGAETAYKMRSETAYNERVQDTTTGEWKWPNQPEDGAFRNCTADRCHTGIDFEVLLEQEDSTLDPSDQPTLWITGCTITARDVGVLVNGRRLMQITGNTFEPLEDAAQMTDIKLRSVHLGILKENIFSGGPRAKNIHVDTEGDSLILGPNSASQSFPVYHSEAQLNRNVKMVAPFTNFTN